MNKQLENRLTMHEGVWTFFGKNAEIINSVPMLKSSVEEYGTTLAAIHLKSSEVDTATTGKVAVKSQAEDDLIAILLPVAAGLFVYGKKRGDAELMEKARVTEYSLRRLRDTELASKGETIAMLAEEHTSDLIPANISSDRIADLKIQVDAYRKALGEREKSVAERKGARITMRDLFYKLDEILTEEIDPAMELIRAAHTQFYNEYFALRVVKETGVRHNKPEPEPAAAAAPTTAK